MCVVSGLYPALNAASLPKGPLRKAGDFKAGQSDVLYVACRSPRPMIRAPVRCTQTSPCCQAALTEDWQERCHSISSSSRYVLQWLRT